MVIRQPASWIHEGPVYQAFSFRTTKKKTAPCIERVLHEAVWRKISFWIPCKTNNLPRLLKTPSRYTVGYKFIQSLFRSRRKMRVWKGPRVFEEL